MTDKSVLMRVGDIFTVRSGNFHATKELDFGDTPLISCGDTDNGFIGFYSIPKNETFQRALTVAYNGSWPLTAKFHPYRFGAKDDVAVLVPKHPLKDNSLFYLAALIDRNKWRYSYGRKCFREKLRNFRIVVPGDVVSDSGELNEDAIANLFAKHYQDFVPDKSSLGVASIPKLRWQTFNITDLFIPRRGDFHSITDLDDGDYPTVSRTTTDNGVVGYFDKPDDATNYDRGSITISTVGADAFVQLDEFIATDNVIVCLPKRALRITTLFFVAFALNRQKWRYSYGRQCYMNKIGKINFHLPVDDSGAIDEDSIQDILEQATYWPLISQRLNLTSPSDTPV